MKYIITESRMEQVAIKYLNKMYGDLKEYRTEKLPNSIFFVKNNKLYMEQELEDEMLWVDYDTIWMDLENMFSLEDFEIQDIISKWVEETYNLKGATPYKMQFYFSRKVVET